MKKNIKYFVLDVDGTLTDGKIYLTNNGDEAKAFNIKDGYGLKILLTQSSIKPIVITGRVSQIVINRCSELGITDLFQGVDDKLKTIKELVNDFSTIAYMGDDDNDLPCMELIAEKGGIIGCPNDASKRVKKIANYISKHNGGDGAVRDFVEWLMGL